MYRPDTEQTRDDVYSTDSSEADEEQFGEVSLTPPDPQREQDEIRRHKGPHVAMER